MMMTWLLLLLMLMVEVGGVGVGARTDSRSPLAHSWRPHVNHHPSRKRTIATVE